MRFIPQIVKQKVRNASDSFRIICGYNRNQREFLKNFKRLVGQKIQERRVQMGFKTQGALAEKLGIDTSRVSDWERGAHLPQGKLKDELLKLLKSDESLIDIDLDDSPGEPPSEVQAIAKEVANQLQAKAPVLPKGYLIIKESDLEELESLVAETSLTEEEMWVIRTLRTINDNERRSIASMLRSIVDGGNKKPRRAKS